MAKTEPADQFLEFLLDQDHLYFLRIHVSAFHIAKNSIDGGFAEQEQQWRTDLYTWFFKL
jgi:hypothetical protein